MLFYLLGAGERRTQQFSAQQSCKLSIGVRAAAGHPRNVHSSCCACLVVDCCLVHFCRVQAEQGLFQNLKSNLQQLQAAKGQKLRMFGAHQDLRAMVDRNM